MTRISQLPGTAAVIGRTDYLEGERLTGASERWQVQQALDVPRYACLLWLGGNVISVPTGAATVLTIDNEAFDDGPIHAAGAQQIVVPADGAGLWMVGYMVNFSANGAGERSCFVTVNGVGSNRVAHVNSAPSPGAAATGVVSSQILRLAANDALRLVTFQTSGGTLNVQGGMNERDSLTRFWAYRLNG